MGRRDVLKTAGTVFTASLAGVTGLSGISLARTAPPGGSDWPKDLSEDFHHDFTAIQQVDEVYGSAATRLDHLYTEFNGDSTSTTSDDTWTYAYRLDATTSASWRESCNCGTDGDLYPARGVNSNVNIKVESDTPSTVSTTYYKADWGFGVTGGSAGNINESPDFWDALITLVAYYHPAVGAVVAAADIYNAIAYEEKDPLDPYGGIDQSFNVSDSTSPSHGHFMKYQHVVPAEERIGSQWFMISAEDSISDILHKTYYSGTDDNFTANYSYEIQTMLSPSQMSTSEKKKYGIKKIAPEQAMTLSAQERRETDGPIYRAENPPIRLVEAKTE